jgi:hypothetical protein
MSFWKIFEKTAYFRLSWHIQDQIINSFRSAKNSVNKISMLNNKDKIIDKVYNNEFSKKRIKK